MPKYETSIVITQAEGVRVLVEADNEDDAYDKILEGKYVRLHSEFYEEEEPEVDMLEEVV